MLCYLRKKGENCVFNKKTWLSKEFNNGLVFLKGNIRGKVFIEYIPAENAWYPVTAPNYMFINCLWVSGQYKGQGFSNELLEGCIRDSKEKGKEGLVILSSDKKRPFLADPKYLKYKGFKFADSAEPFFHLYYLPFNDNSTAPTFNNNVKDDHSNDSGFELYYSNQCPFTEKYVGVIKETADKLNEKINIIKFDTSSKAQNSHVPFTTYSLRYNGKFVTNEILTDKKFTSLVDNIR